MVRVEASPDVEAALKKREEEDPDVSEDDEDLENQEEEEVSIATSKHMSKLLRFLNPEFEEQFLSSYLRHTKWQLLLSFCFVALAYTVFVIDAVALIFLRTTKVVDIVLGPTRCLPFVVSIICVFYVIGTNRKKLDNFASGFYIPMVGGTEVDLRRRKPRRSCCRCRVLPLAVLRAGLALCLFVLAPGTFVARSLIESWSLKHVCMQGLPLPDGALPQRVLLTLADNSTWYASPCILRQLEAVLILERDELFVFHVVLAIGIVFVFKFPFRRAFVAFFVGWSIEWVSVAITWFMFPRWFLAIGDAVYLVLLSLLLFLVTLLGLYIIERLLRSRFLKEQLLAVERVAIEEERAEKARQQLRLKARFLSSISHELRSPLHISSGLLDMLVEDYSSGNVPPSVVYDVLLAVEKHVSRVADLNEGALEKFLVHSGVEGLGGWDREPRYDYLRNLLRDQIKAVNDAVIAKGIDMFVHCDLTLLPSKLGDSFRVSQILSELVSNSVKFSDSEVVKVSLRKVEVPATSMMWGGVGRIADVGGGVGGGKEGVGRYSAFASNNGRTKTTEIEGARASLSARGEPAHLDDENDDSVVVEIIVQDLGGGIPAANILSMLQNCISDEGAPIIIEWKRRDGTKEVLDAHGRVGGEEAIGFFKTLATGKNDGDKKTAMSPRGASSSTGGSDADKQNADSAYVEVAKKSGTEVSTVNDSGVVSKGVAENPLDSEVHGLGVGLTFSLKLVAHLKGAVYVSTEEGKGTKVIVRLPLTSYSKSADRMNTKGMLGSDDDTDEEDEREVFDQDATPSGQCGETPSRRIALIGSTSFDGFYEDTFKRFAVIERIEAAVLQGERPGLKQRDKVKYVSNKLKTVTDSGTRFGSDGSAFVGESVKSKDGTRGSRWCIFIECPSTLVPITIDARKKQRLMEIRLPQSEKEKVISASYEYCVDQLFAISHNNPGMMESHPSIIVLSYHAQKLSDLLTSSINYAVYGLQKPLCSWEISQSICRVMAHNDVMASHAIDPIKEEDEDDNKDNVEDPHPLPGGVDRGEGRGAAVVQDASPTYLTASSAGVAGKSVAGGRAERMGSVVSPHVSHSEHSHDGDGRILGDDNALADVEEIVPPLAMVVDDEKFCITVAKRMLKRLGYVTVWASSGEEALEILEAADRTNTITADGHTYALTQDSSIEFILMDIQMPGISGMEATQKIREKSWRFESVPIFAATAGADEMRCLAAGMTGYVRKPFRAADVSSLLKSSLPSFDFA
mmetsp:Transcript_8668/g.23320  ORF Transcript_8668/g.23320 Transcript_8668/m.23320 type:complete len:1250 (-) Transcript_8668:246-3995(-)